MRRHFIGEEKFLGHVGGDDFFIGVSGWTREEVSTVLFRVLSEFRSDVRQLYSAEHREAGYMTGHGRSGETSVFALMRCSIAVLILPEGFVFSDAQAVSARIAEIKSLAKDSDDGLVFETFGAVEG